MLTTRIFNSAAFGFAGAMVAQSGAAQSLLPPPPAVNTTPPAFQQDATTDQSQALDAALLSTLPKGLPFSYGPVTFRPHLFYQFLYGDGIASSPADRHATAIHQISPGMLMNLGQKWTLDYTPTLRYYSSKEFKDGLDHRVSFGGGTIYNDWSFGLSQGYSYSTAPQVETLSQGATESFNTGLHAGYQINSRMALDLSVNQAFSSQEGFQSYRDWSTMDYLDYQFFPKKLSAGIGLGGGYTDVDSPGSDMTTEQLQARASWTPADKTTFDVHGGLEIRQFLSGGAEDLLNPIYGVAAHYYPFTTTTISLSADRTVSASYFNNQVNETTSVILGLNQRLLKRLNLSLSGSYSKSDYVEAMPGLSTARNDDRYSFIARLGTQILKRGSIGISYTYQKTESDVALYSYDSNMIGFDIGYRW